MKKQFLVLFIGVFLLVIPFANYAQIRVIEAERNASTAYSAGTHQDSVYIVYKGENNKSTITLVAYFNGIDSLNFNWFFFNSDTKQFESLQNTDSVRSDTIKYHKLADNMNEYEGAYRVHIHNQQKGIDTIFTIWVWYQDFFINSVSIFNSTCEELELRADVSFDDNFVYYDLSLTEAPELFLENEAVYAWTVDSDKESDNRSGLQPRFTAPVEETTYLLKANDAYGYTREWPVSIDETKLLRGYPVLRAVSSQFFGIHGQSSTIDKELMDTVKFVQLEAPYGVEFTNNSKNGEEFEWIFYNHKDWRTSEVDTVLEISDLYEPLDSIYYLRPPYDTVLSPLGYDVKLKVWGPIYNDNNKRCVDSIIKPEYVVVTPTRFPDDYKLELPNVFSPHSNIEKNTRFYFLEDSKPKSIQYFSIKIYNRWGNKVYEYEDNDGSWQESGKSNPGWDGTTRVGTQAKAGVYYYTILAKGWDGRDFKVGGFVHIFYQGE
jgi:hypothetical protein